MVLGRFSVTHLQRVAGETRPTVRSAQGWRVRLLTLASPASLTIRVAEIMIVLVLRLKDFA